MHEVHFIRDHFVRRSFFMAPYYHTRILSKQASTSPVGKVMIMELKIYESSFVMMRNYADDGVKHVM